MSNAIKRSVVSTYLNVPEPLIASDAVAATMYPWRTFISKYVDGNSDDSSCIYNVINISSWNLFSYLKWAVCLLIWIVNAKESCKRTLLCLQLWLCFLILVPKSVTVSFLARDSIYAVACYMPSPVRLSVRPSHGWISQRLLKLGSRNLHLRVAPWL